MTLSHRSRPTPARQAPSWPDGRASGGVPAPRVSCYAISSRSARRRSRDDPRDRSPGSGDGRDVQEVAAQDRIAGRLLSVEDGAEDIAGNLRGRPRRADERDADEPTRDAPVTKVESHECPDVRATVGST